jgi:uncharacterized protein
MTIFKNISILVFIFLFYSVSAQKEFELLKAAERGDSARVVELIDSGASANTTYNTGETALILAAKKNSEFIVRLLIEHGAFINIKSKYGTTALQFAVSHKNLKLVQYLSEKGADFNQDASSLLIMAAQRSDMDMLKYLLDEKQLSIHSREPDGKTALIQACIAANMETIRYLVEYGSNVNAMNDNVEDNYFKLSMYGTPLMHAAARGRLDLISFLIEKGAKIDIRTHAGNTALIIAVIQTQFPAAKLLIEKGADVNDQDKNGYTVLMHAAIKNNLDFVKYLVDKGVMVNMKNKKGKTVYDILEVQIKMEKQFKDKYSKSQTLEILKYLKSVGAKPGSKV